MTSIEKDQSNLEPNNQIDASEKLVFQTFNQPDTNIKQSNEGKELINHRSQMLIEVRQEDLTLDQLAMA